MNKKIFYCITIDKDGIECQKEEATYPFVPGPGFEKLEDGNFLKKIDDPRCIIDPIVMHETEQHRYEQNTQLALFKDEANLNTKTQETKTSISIQQEEPDNSEPGVVAIQVIMCGDRKYRLHEFRSLYIANHECHTVNTITVVQGFLKDGLGRPELAWNKTFEKMLIDIKTKSVSIWFSKPERQNPDVYLFKILKDET